MRRPVKTKRCLRLPRLPHPKCRIRYASPAVQRRNFAAGLQTMNAEHSVTILASVAGNTQEWMRVAKPGPHIMKDRAYLNYVAREMGQQFLDRDWFPHASTAQRQALNDAFNQITIQSPPLSTRDIPRHAVAPRELLQ